MKFALRARCEPNQLFIATLDKETHQDENVCFSSIFTADCQPSQPANHHISKNCHRIAQIVEGHDQLDGAHRPVTAQIVGKQQQPKIHRYEVVVGELARWRWTHACRIIEPAKMSLNCRWTSFALYNVLLNFFFRLGREATQESKPMKLRAASSVIDPSTNTKAPLPQAHSESEAFHFHVNIFVLFFCFSRKASRQTGWPWKMNVEGKM